MGKYQQILDAAPEGATHVYLKGAFREIERERQITAFYKKNISWYAWNNGAYTYFPKFTRMRGEPQSIISLDSVKILARHFN